MRLKAQQRGRLELTRICTLGKEDWVMREEPRKLPGDHAHGVDCRVATGRARGRNAYIAMSLTAENHQVDHNPLRPPRIIARTIGRRCLVSRGERQVALQ